MNKKEFVKTCVLCGYASKKRAIEYAKSKDELTEGDYAKIFRINERENDLKHGILMHQCQGDGDYLISLLGHKPTPWKRDIDLNRGLRETWDDLEDLEEN